MQGGDQVTVTTAEYLDQRTQETATCLAETLNTFQNWVQARFERDIELLKCNRHLTGKGGRNRQLKRLLPFYRDAKLHQALPMAAAGWVYQLEGLETPEVEDDD